MKKDKKKIGDILMDAGLISSEQIEIATKLQRRNKKKLGRICIELGFVSEKDVAKAIAHQFSIPVIDLEDFSVDETLIKLIPKELAEEKLIFPVSLKGKKLRVVTVDPMDLTTIDEISFRNGLFIDLAIGMESQLVKAVEKYYGSSDRIWNIIKEIPDQPEVELVKDAADEDYRKANRESLTKLSEAPPVVKLVDTIIVDAVKAGASDIHIEPGESDVTVRYRIDGQLEEKLKYPRNAHAAVVSRVKIISRLDITRRMIPQDGRSTLKVQRRDVDLRISTLPSVHGETIVVRILDKENNLIELSKLGIPENDLNWVTDLISSPQGIILVTGPTGSGKTTTLYAVLQQLSSKTNNLISVEDPVEYKIAGITQVQLNPKAGMTFPNALRAILRQDPDIVMIGEIRDPETAEIAVRASITGHLVLSTLHTNDTVSSIIRLLDIGTPAYMVNSSLIGVISQRLVRKICPRCKTRIEIPKELMQSGLPPIKAAYEGKGCEYCRFTGYHGREAVYEFLDINTDLRRLISSFKTEQELWHAARENGLKTIFENAWEKANMGITTFSEIFAKIPRIAYGKG